MILATLELAAKGLWTGIWIGIGLGWLCISRSASSMCIGEFGNGWSANEKEANR